ncbi:MAG: hypothetical protein KJ732_01740, partial [Candidatus Margulisbacteria bacterium]|nr:hypothetical protein [Candidatus Margulisiibacteriota bacterium]
AEYVKKKYGQEGIDKIQNQLKQLGYPFEYDKAKALEWYPLGLRALSLLAIKDTFGLSDEDLKEMGNLAPKFSFLVKIFMKSFVSPKMTVAHAPEFWERHYSVGKLESEYHGDENRAIIKIKDFTLYPEVLKYLEGYFQRVMQYTVGKNVECKILDNKTEKKSCLFEVIW